MLHKADVVPLLLAACPESRSAWDEHQAYWAGEEAGAFLDVAVFAHYIVERVQDGHTECFPAFFAAIERMLTVGDEEVQALASIGLLEDLQNNASHEPFGADVFLPWLSPIVRKAWDHVAAQWEGKHSLADVIRAERHLTIPDTPSP